MGLGTLLKSRFYGYSISEKFKPKFTKAFSFKLFICSFNKRFLFFLGSFLYCSLIEYGFAVLKSYRTFLTFRLRAAYEHFLEKPGEQEFKSFPKLGIVINPFSSWLLLHLLAENFLSRCNDCAALSPLFLRWSMCFLLSPKIPNSFFYYFSLFFFSSSTW